MALNETKTLIQVSISPTSGVAHAKWKIDIDRDGEIVSSSNHIKAYTADQAAEFAAEVEGAASYIAALGWNV